MTGVGGSTGPSAALVPIARVASFACTPLGGIEMPADSGTVAATVTPAATACASVSTSRGCGEEAEDAAQDRDSKRAASPPDRLMDGTAEPPNDGSVTETVSPTRSATSSLNATSRLVVWPAAAAPP